MNKKLDEFRFIVNVKNSLLKAMWTNSLYSSYGFDTLKEAHKFAASITKNKQFYYYEKLSASFVEDILHDKNY